MEYYRSAHDQIMGSGSPGSGSGSGSDSANHDNQAGQRSPSAVFENGYVPFSTIAPRSPSVTSLFSDSEEMADDLDSTYNPDSLSPADVPIPSIESDDDSSPSDESPGFMSEDLVIRAPPNSPVDSSLSLSHPVANVALLMENRRPGRPRGGRLSDAERYCRAVAAALHNAGTTLQGSNQGAGQAEGLQAGNHLGPGANRQAASGMASGASGVMAGRHNGQGQFSATSTLNGAGADLRSRPGFISPAGNSGGHYTLSNSSSPGISSYDASQSGQGTTGSGTSNTVSTSANSTLARSQSQNHMGSNFTASNTTDQPSAGTDFTYTSTQLARPAAMSARYDPVHHNEQFVQQPSLLAIPAPQYMEPSALQYSQLTGQNPGTTQLASHYQTQNQTHFLVPDPSQNQQQDQQQVQTALFSQSPQYAVPIPAPLAILHDLPPSVQKRASFQKILKMAIDPKQIPEGCTPQEASLLTASQIHVASAKFNKSRERNNKSAKKGRYMRLGWTVSLADEVMRLRHELKQVLKLKNELCEQNDQLCQQKNEMEQKINRLEDVLPGIMNASEVTDDPSNQISVQGGGFQAPAIYTQGYDTGAGPSYLGHGSNNFDPGNQQFHDEGQQFGDATQQINNALQQFNDGAQQFNDGAQQFSDGTQQFSDGTQQFSDGTQQFSDGIQQYTSSDYTSNNNALGIMPGPTDAFGDPVNANQAFSPFSAQQNYSMPMPEAYNTGLTFPPGAESSNMSNAQQHDRASNSIQPNDSASNAGNDSFSSTSHLELVDKIPMLGAKEMRCQLIDAVRSGKLYNIADGCHEEIDAVVQRGRQIRSMLGMKDPDYDNWQPGALKSGSGRRKRIAKYMADDDDEEEEEEDVGKGKPKGKGKGKAVPRKKGKYN